jgi:aspartate/tyrosine/aromatic aminotransferase
MSTPKIAGESRWANIPLAPADPILGVAVAFNADSHADKVNLGMSPLYESCLLYMSHVSSI